jgi:hypothetical protein
MKLVYDFKEITFYDVPMSVCQRVSLIDSSYVYSKAATQFIDPETNKAIFVGGFTLSKDRELGKTIAQYEVLERLFAMPAFASEKEMFEGYLFKDKDENKKVVRRHRSELLLGMKPGIQRFKNDASGLAIHTDNNSAVETAVFEVIERDLLGMIWYDQTIRLMLTCHKEKKNLCISWYKLANYPDLPFRLCTITDDHNLFACGSSIKSSSKLAEAKSFEEAGCLAESVLNEEFGSTNGFDDKTRKKIQSLKSDLSIERKEYFKRCLVSPIESEHTIMSLIQVLDILQVHTDHIDIYPILQSEQPKYPYTLIRAMVAGLKGLRQWRIELKNTYGLEDPFC